MSAVAPPLAARPAVPAWALWRQWVLANVAGEIVGFGSAALLGAGAGSVIERVTGGAQVAAMVAAVVAAGALEGACVGMAQWLALRRSLPTIRRGAWLSATVAGAVVAWGAGMAVGTSMGDAVGSSAPSAALLVLGGAAIGAMAGGILAVPQWLVLRRAVQRAGWWVPAHALAWAAGMLVAFAGMAFIDERTPVALVAAIAAGTGLAMGALVAAFTGIALVRLVVASTGACWSTRTSSTRHGTSQRPLNT